MTDNIDLNTRIEALEKSMQSKLGLRGKTLGAQLKRAGRLLPKRIHKAGKSIIQAHELEQHPKLARMNDPVVINAAFNTIETHLSGIDPAERRKDAVLGFFGRLVLNLMFVGLGVYMLLRWQGVI